MKDKSEAKYFFENDTDNSDSFSSIEELRSSDELKRTINPFFANRMNDATINITTFISPYDLVHNLSLVDKSFNQATQSSVYWQERMQNHFPDKYSKPTQRNVDWLRLFKSTYQSKYKEFTIRQKRLFSLVKEGDLNSIRKENIQYTTLHDQDTDGISLLSIIAQHRQSAIPSYFYDLIAAQRLDDFGDKWMTKVDNRGFTMLHWAAVLNQWDDFEQMLVVTHHSNIDIGGSGYRHITPLYQAAKIGNEDAVHTLIKLGADIELGHPIYIAAECGHTGVVDVLVNAGAVYDGALYSGFSPLYVAAKQGHVEVVRRLLQQRDIQVNFLGRDGSSALYVAAQNNHPEVCALLLNHGASVDVEFLDGYKPLYIASQNGGINVLRTLAPYITTYDDIMPNGATSLYVAAQNGYSDCVEFLCQQGAAIDSTYNGYTPLYIAAQKGYFNIVETLLNYGANIDKMTNKSATPLYVACQKGHLAIVRLLLEHDANAEVQFENGFTPLHIICSQYFEQKELQENYLKITTLLLDRVSRFDVNSNAGQTPLDLAIERSEQINSPLIDLLINYQNEMSDIQPRC